MWSMQKKRVTEELDRAQVSKGEFQRQLAGSNDPEEPPSMEWFLTC